MVIVRDGDDELQQTASFTILRMLALSSVRHSRCTRVNIGDCNNIDCSMK